MTKIQCRYGKANFELTKACLAGHEAIAASPNFARHFSRIQSAMKMRSSYGDRLQSETSPRYSRQPDSAWRLLRAYPRSTTPNGAPDSPAASASRQQATAQPPPQEPEIARQASLPQFSVAFISSLLAIGVAVIVGLAIGRSGSFRNAVAPLLPMPASRHMASGPIVPQAAIEPVARGVPAATPEAPPATVAVAPPALAVAEAPAEPAPPAKAEPPTPRKTKASADETPRKVRHLKKKKHKKARAEPPSKSKSNPFTGDKPPYSAQAPAPSGMHARLEQCKRLGNLIRAELCKWRACKNKWGRDGCPSYDQANPGSVGMRPALLPYRAGIRGHSP